MKSFIHTLVIFAALLGFGSSIAQAAPPIAAGQARKVTLDAGTLQRPVALFSPKADGIVVGPIREGFQRVWFALECKIKLKSTLADGKEDKEPYLNNVKVEFVVAADNPKSKEDSMAPKMILVKKTIKYINVPTNEDFHVSCYMSPTTVKLLTGTNERLLASMGRECGIVVYAGDTAIAFATRAEAMKPLNESQARLLNSAQSPLWWIPKAGKEKEFASRYLEADGLYPLLDKSETAFAPFFADRYPDIAKDSPKADAKVAPAAATAPAAPAGNEP